MKRPRAWHPQAADCWGPYGQQFDGVRDKLAGLEAWRIIHFISNANRRITSRQRSFELEIINAKPSSEGFIRDKIELLVPEIQLQKPRRGYCNNTMVIEKSIIHMVCDDDDTLISSSQMKTDKTYKKTHGSTQLFADGRIQERNSGKKLRCSENFAVLIIKTHGNL